ncbi:hypothetical protein Tco_1560692 [Tanacetum coccineum]
MSSSHRLLVLVVVGIVVRIIVGKNQVGLDFIEKFGYVRIVVKVAIVWKLSGGGGICGCRRVGIRQRK